MYITDLTAKVVYFEDNIYTDRVEFSRKNLPYGVDFIELKGLYNYRGKIVIN